MRDVQTGIDEFMCSLIRWLSCRFGSGRFRRLTMGVTQLKVEKEEGAGAVRWPNPDVDDATFHRILPVRLAKKSRTPSRLIFSQNRPRQLASFPHPVPTRLRQ